MTSFVQLAGTTEFVEETLKAIASGLSTGQYPSNKFNMQSHDERHGDGYGQHENAGSPPQHPIPIRIASAVVAPMRYSSSDEDEDDRDHKHRRRHARRNRSGSPSPSKQTGTNRAASPDRGEQSQNQRRVDSRSNPRDGGRPQRNAGERGNNRGGFAPPVNARLGGRHNGTQNAFRERGDFGASFRGPPRGNGDPFFHGPPQRQPGPGMRCGLSV
eukprot:1190005-Prorocentrum_minimum.AAC.4